MTSTTPMGRLVEELLRSPEPSIRWRIRTGVLGEDPDSRRLRPLAEAIRRSPRARALLEGIARDPHRNPYSKWQGSHWVFLTLAELGYPPDPGVRSIWERVRAMWTRPYYHRRLGPGSHRMQGIRVIVGRPRVHASQQGAALLAASRFGFPQRETQELAELLLGWQWPDGGWNCDPVPSADTSSFMETLLPMRGLGAYADRWSERRAGRAASGAAEVFLERQMFRRRSSGAIIRPEFVKLHFPLYWHYDVLAGLRGVAEIGRIRDPRAQPALEWLERRALSQGGWSADASYTRGTRRGASLGDHVGWGPISPRRRNDWVTADALFVLSVAGRLAV